MFGLIFQERALMDLSDSGRFDNKLSSSMLTQNVSTYDLMANYSQIH